MDLDQLWAEANASLPKDISSNQIKQAMILESNNHIAKLAKRIRYQRNYAIAFLIGFFILVPYAISNQVALICLSIAILFYIIAAILLHLGWKGIRDFNPSHLSAKESISAQLRVIDKTLKLNKLWGYGAMPILLLAILIGSYAYKTGASVEEMISNIDFLRQAAFSGLVLLPLGYALSMSMTRKAFDKLYGELKSNFDAIQKLDTEANSNA